MDTQEQGASYCFVPDNEGARGKIAGYNVHACQDTN